MTVMTPTGISMLSLWQKVGILLLIGDNLAELYPFSLCGNSLRKLRTSWLFIYICIYCSGKVMNSLYFPLSVPSILEKRDNHKDSGLQVLMSASADAEWYELKGREIPGVRGQAICLPLQLLREKGPLFWGETCSFWWAASQGKSWNQSILGASGNVPAPCSGHFASARTQSSGLTSAKAFRCKDLWKPTVNHYATWLSQTQWVNLFLCSYLLTNLNLSGNFWCCSFWIPHHSTI